MLPIYQVFVNDGSPQPGNRAVARLPRAPKSGRELLAGPTGTRKEPKPPSVPQRQRQRQRQRRRTPRPGGPGVRAACSVPPAPAAPGAPSSSPKHQLQRAGVVEDGMTLTSCACTSLRPAVAVAFDDRSTRAASRADSRSVSSKRKSRLLKHRILLFVSSTPWRRCKLHSKSATVSPNR